MGSGQSLNKQRQTRSKTSRHEQKDYKDVLIPGDVSRIISKFILAYSDGYFYPCMIMRPSENIRDGYVVYFFYLKEERDIPPNFIIGNLWYLINCEVTYTDNNGNIAIGRIVGTDFKSTDTESDQPMNLFIYTNDSCRTVSFPYIFLTPQQARILCG